MIVTETLQMFSGLLKKPCAKRDSYGKEKVKAGDCGGIYQRWGKNREKGHPPAVNASGKPHQSGLELKAWIAASGLWSSDPRQGR